MSRTLFLVCLLGLAGCAEPPTAVRWTVEELPFRATIFAEGRLEAVEVSKVMVPQQVPRSARVEWLASDGGKVDDEELVVRFDGSAFIEQLDQGRFEMLRAESTIFKRNLDLKREEITLESRMQLAGRRMQLAEQFNLEDSEVYSRMDLLDSQIDLELAEADLRLAGRRAVTLKSLGARDDDLAKIQRQQAQLQIDEASQGLEALDVAAEDGGFFTVHDGITVGTEVWRGREVGEIPDLAKLSAEVWVLEADAGGIQAGQEVFLDLDSRPGLRLEGVVDFIAAVAEQVDRVSPVRYFKIGVSLDSDLPPDLRPGLSISANIVIANRERALIVPRHAVGFDAGEPFVTLVESTTLRRQPVELGVRTLGWVEVVTGLSAGQTISLAPPRDQGTQAGDEADS